VSELELAFVKSIVSVPSSVLDVGAGAGQFCRTAAKAGWDVVGVDPAATETLVKEGKGQFRLVKGTLDNLEPGRRFPVVTLWDVIEHVENPVGLLKDVHSRLTPNGHVFLETGNFQSWERIDSGSSWWCYQVDHRWYFSPHVMKRLLAANGFTEIQVCADVLRPDWRRPELSQFTSWRRTVKECIKRPSACGEVFQRGRSLRRAGREWPDWADLGIFAMCARRSE
jgi:SAM-dependent methyltransferase